MTMRQKALLRFSLLGLILLALVGIAAAATPYVKDWLKASAPHPSADVAATNSIELVPQKHGAFVISNELKQTMGIETAPVKKAEQTRPLRLSGTLALDANHMVRVHSRFAGEIREIGTIEALKEHPSTVSTEIRPLRFGDKVTKGQLLAVVWSRELGEKKSELVDAISALHVDQETLNRFKTGYKEGVIPERNVREQEAKVAIDRNAVFRVERTLRVWQLSDEEIDGIKVEAERIFANKKENQSESKQKDWPRVEVRAPFDGTILEKNIAVGDMVDTTTDLFKVADMHHLTVWAHAYEEDLPSLQALSPEQRRWSIALDAAASARPLQGVITKIGDLIDPNQHTALIMGHVDNLNDNLRAGQFVSATVHLPPPRGEVEIPTSAFVEDGSDSIVLVAVDLSRNEFAVRRVSVARRTQEVVGIRIQPLPKELAEGVEPLRPGEIVISAGALELVAALKDLQAAVNNHPKTAQP